MDFNFTHVFLMVSFGILICIVLPDFILFSIRKIIKILRKHFGI